MGGGRHGTEPGATGNDPSAANGRSGGLPPRVVLAMVGFVQLLWARRMRPPTKIEHDLPESVAVAVVHFLYGPLAEDPYRVGKPLRFHLEGYRSLGEAHT